MSAARLAEMYRSPKLRDRWYTETPEPETRTRGHARVRRGGSAARSTLIARGEADRRQDEPGGRPIVQIEAC